MEKKIKESNRLHDGQASNDAGSLIRQWAALFSGSIFVKIIVYADESGANDPKGERADSHIPVVCGYIGMRSEWIKFCRDWKVVLDRYEVPYFHYREMANNKDAASIYYEWKTDKVFNFLYDLAEIAGRQIPVGGQYNLEAHTKLGKATDKYPFSYVFEHFFQDVLEAVKEHELAGEIHFFFDQQTGNTPWESAVVRTAREIGNRRIGSITFADKKKCPHWPLQAADLIAYRTRRAANEGLKTCFDIFSQQWIPIKQKVEIKVLDAILQRNMHPYGFHPFLNEEFVRQFAEHAPKYPSLMRVMNEQPRGSAKKQ